MSAIRVGITGQAGFMGTHLYNHLGLAKGITRIPFEDQFFESEKNLRKFVRQCDAIVHLAALNRHEDPQVIYDTNIRLVEALIEAMQAENVAPHIIFASSTQEQSDNPYGASKLEGRRLFEAWAEQTAARFTGTIIPNVYGPFGQPDYNSVVATFCHRVANGLSPEIHVDGLIKLIYINNLCSVFIRIVKGHVEENPYIVAHDSEKRVSEILNLLNRYKELYIDRKVIPELTDPFERDLFNTFVCYIDQEKFYPGALHPHRDERGSFVEVIKLFSGGQISFSTTRPGVTRGNHYHIRKFERFAVIRGRARIDIRRIGSESKLSFELDGNNPGFVDMPVWHTHNITNIGDDDLYTIFWINEMYDQDDPDTYYEQV